MQGVRGKGDVKSGPQDRVAAPFNPYPRLSYDRDTKVVARSLLGRLLARRLHGSWRVVRLVEVEAYLGFDDAASHVGNGRFTPRTRATWGRPGLAYVFDLHGRHCLNAVTLSTKPFGVVLLRGGEPLRLDRRGFVHPDGKPVRDGPGKLTEYLGVDRSMDGEDLVTGSLRLLADGFEPDAVRVTPRVGITRNAEAPLRFVVHRFEGEPDLAWSRPGRA